MLLHFILHVKMYLVQFIFEVTYEKPRRILGTSQRAIQHHDNALTLILENRDQFSQQNPPPMNPPLQY